MSAIEQWKPAYGYEGIYELPTAATLILALWAQARVAGNVELIEERLK